MTDDTIDGQSALSADLISALESNDRDRIKEAVATVNAGDLAAYLRTDEGGSALEHAFNSMPSFYVPGQVNSDMTVRWNVEHPPAEPIAMDVVITPQQCQTVAVSDTRAPTVTVTLDALSFVELASG